MIEIPQFVEIGEVETSAKELQNFCIIKLHKAQKIEIEVLISLVLQPMTVERIKEIFPPWQPWEIIPIKGKLSKATAHNSQPLLM